MEKLPNSKLFYIIMFTCCAFFSVQLVQKSNIANYPSALLANMDALAFSENLDGGEGGGWIVCSPPPQGLCQVPYYYYWDEIYPGYWVRIITRCLCTGLKEDYCLLEDHTD